MPVEDVITVSVPVTDQGRALAFYAGTLGLKLARVDETTLGVPPRPGHRQRRDLPEPGDLV